MAQPKNEIVIDDVDEFLAALAEEDKTIVHPAVYTEGGKKIKFLVKEFDQDEILEIATAPMIFVDGKLVKKPKHEAEMGINLRIYHGIVRNDGSEENPRYVKQFTLPQIRQLYTGRKRGQLLNFLLEAVCRFNPDVDVTKKK